MSPRLVWGRSHVQAVAVGPVEIILVFQPQHKLWLKFWLRSKPLSEYGYSIWMSCLQKLDMLYCSSPIFCEIMTILHSSEENENWGRIAILSTGAQKRSGMWDTWVIDYPNHFHPELSSFLIKWFINDCFAFDSFTFSVLLLWNQITDFTFMNHCLDDCHLSILPRNLGVYISHVFQSLSQPFSLQTHINAIVLNL